MPTAADQHSPPRAKIQMSPAQVLLRPDGQMFANRILENIVFPLLVGRRDVTQEVRYTVATWLPTVLSRHPGARPRALQFLFELAERGARERGLRIPCAEFSSAFGRRVGSGQLHKTRSGDRRPKVSKSKSTAAKEGRRAVSASSKKVTFAGPSTSGHAVVAGHKDAADLSSAVKDDAEACSGAPAGKRRRVASGGVAAASASSAGASPEESPSNTAAAAGAAKKAAKAKAKSGDAGTAAAKASAKSVAASAGPATGPDTAGGAAIAVGGTTAPGGPRASSSGTTLTQASPKRGRPRAPVHELLASLDSDDDVEEASASGEGHDDDSSSEEDFLEQQASIYEEDPDLLVLMTFGGRRRSRVAAEPTNIYFEDRVPDGPPPASAAAESTSSSGAAGLVSQGSSSSSEGATSLMMATSQKLAKAIISPETMVDTALRDYLHRNPTYARLNAAVPRGDNTHTNSQLYADHVRNRLDRQYDVSEAQFAGAMY